MEWKITKPLAMAFPVIGGMWEEALFMYLPVYISIPSGNKKNTFIQFKIER